MGVFITPISVVVFRTKDDACVKVNCVTNSFKDNLGQIAQDVIIILYRLKNLNIHAKQPENKTAICLVYFLFYNQVVIDSLRVCHNWISIFAHILYMN